MHIVIIGGGIAGLFTAMMVQSRSPETEVTILEKSGRLGGRIFTKELPDGSVFESGAGRLNMDHKVMIALLKRYGLDKEIIPISSEISVKLGPLLKDDEYKDVSPEEILQNMARDVADDMLHTHTIEEIVRELYGEDAVRKVVHQFEYDSEIQIARAKTSLRAITDTFRGEFGVLKGGLSRLVNALKEEIRGRILLNTECVSIERLEDGKYDLTLDSRWSINADKIVVCTPRKSACELLSHVIGGEMSERLYGESVIQDEPLMRIYARFPYSWIDKKTVTRKGVRYIIPVSQEPAIVMISYTDGPIARIWSNFREEVGDRDTSRELMSQLRSLFPRRNIPDPIWISFEEYPVGASYWRPSPIDITTKKQQNDRQNPSKNIFVCGEFLSIYNQAWIEGALERCLRAIKDIIR